MLLMSMFHMFNCLFVSHVRIRVLFCVFIVLMTRLFIHMLMHDAIGAELLQGK